MTRRFRQLQLFIPRIAVGRLNKIDKISLLLLFLINFSTKTSMTIFNDDPLSTFDCAILTLD